jgi:hypothetical protein
VSASAAGADISFDPAHRSVRDPVPYSRGALRRDLHPACDYGPNGRGRGAPARRFPLVVVTVTGHDINPLMT